MTEGTPSAYFGTCVSGFPNFFMLMGPNTVTGHLSVIYTVECQINFTIRVIRPLIQSMRSPRTLLPRARARVDKVAVLANAHRLDNDWIQRKAKELVWATGCTSWFIDPKTGRNTQMYPDWQYRFWTRSIFIQWQDFAYGQSKALGEQERRNRRSWVALCGKSLLAVSCCVAVLAIAGKLDLTKVRPMGLKDISSLIKTPLVIEGTRL